MTDPQMAMRDVVLVVDDEQDVRRMATLALSEAGYRAEVAEDGKSGLECFIQHEPSICLVLADVVMPVMDGLQTVEKILGLAPAMKILLMTGYSEAELRILSQTNFAVIRKPFFPEDLRRTINATLGLGGTAKASLA